MGDIKEIFKNVPERLYTDVVCIILPAYIFLVSISSLKPELVQVSSSIVSLTSGSSHFFVVIGFSYLIGQLSIVIGDWIVFVISRIFTRPKKKSIFEELPNIIKELFWINQEKELPPDYWVSFKSIGKYPEIKNLMFSTKSNTTLYTNLFVLTFLFGWISHQASFYLLSLVWLVEAVRESNFYQTGMDHLDSIEEFENEKN